MKNIHVIIAVPVAALFAISASACDGDDAVAPSASTTDAGTDAGETVDSASADAPNDVAPAHDGFSDTEWAALVTLTTTSAAVPPDTTNKYADDAKAATLGQMLFFEKSYAGALVVGDDGTNGGLGTAGDKGKVACASCHGGAALIDTRSKPGNVSLGTNFGTRNALAVANSSFYAWSNWGGRFDSQWSLPLAVAENAKIMASTRLDVVHMIWAKYKTEYEAVFGALDPALDPAAGDANRFPPSGKPKASASDPDGPWELMTAEDRTTATTIFVNYGKAIQAYERKLVSHNAPFDRYMAGDHQALSDAQKRGARLFVGRAGCAACHSGPTLSDGMFHALAVPQTGPNVPAADLGRFSDVPPLLASAFNTSGNFSDDKNTSKLTGLAQDASQRGQFRTPSLRGVALTAPYMHSGQMASLGDVIDFYAAGGGDPGDAGFTKDSRLTPFGLTGTDKADIVAFLDTLTGEALAAALVQDTSK